MGGREVKSAVKLLFATRNDGKITELTNYSKKFNCRVVNKNYTMLLSQKITETGSSFKTNATIKLQSVLNNIEGNDVLVIADDSGLEIPALGNEPGVHTRRWSGHEMTDKEITKYCLERMKDLNGNERKAIFKTILAVGRKNGQIKYYSGALEGLILKKPRSNANEVKGLPFR